LSSMLAIDSDAANHLRYCHAFCGRTRVPVPFGGLERLSL